MFTPTPRGARLDLECLEARGGGWTIARPTNAPVSLPPADGLDDEDPLALARGLRNVFVAAAMAAALLWLIL
jgi:hypothetical protein